MRNKNYERQFVIVEPSLDNINESRRVRNVSFLGGIAAIAGGVALMTLGHEVPVGLGLEAVGLASESLALLAAARYGTLVERRAASQLPAPIQMAPEVQN